MLALSMAEGFVRRVFSFYQSRLHASSSFSSKSFVSPTCRISFRNSFVSPTYAKTGGYTPLKMSARRHFLSLLSQSPLSALLFFNHLRTLSFFGSQLSRVLPTGCALFAKKPGGRGYCSYQSSSLSAVDCRLLASPSYSLPCPTTDFPLQWEYPFPVITGENQ